MHLITNASLSILVLSSVLTAQCEFEELIPSGADTNQQFGFAVATDGIGTVLVGAPRADGADQDSGLAYVFVLVGNTWVESAVLGALDGKDTDHFGDAVALCGNVAVIGAPFDDDLGPESGSAYVFEEQGGTWTQIAKLKASDGAPSDFFGTSVAIDGDRIIVGAPADEITSPPQGGTGSAYVFEKSIVWSQSAKIISSVSALDDNFGHAVALVGDQAFITAPWPSASGSVFVFQETGGVWNETQSFSGLIPATNDEYGYSVAAFSDRFVVGSRADSLAATRSGAAYVYRDVGGVWVQEAALVNSDAGIGKEFGEYVAIGDGIIAVGRGNGDAAYIYEREAFGWIEKVILQPNPGLPTGRPVALLDNGAVLGEGPHNPGISYVYSEPQFGWGNFVQPLLGCPEEVSMFAGGTQVLDLAAGPQYAGDFYLVLGSSTGTSGFYLQGVFIPLFPDDWFGFSLASANNPPPFINTLGTLDADGAATAFLTFPPNSDPNLAGWTLYHAYITFTLSPFTITFASNAVPLDLLP